MVVNYDKRLVSTRILALKCRPFFSFLLSVVSLIVGLGFTSSASAQTLPFHMDPNAREEIPDLTNVPAIRFLTSTGFPPFNYRDEGGRLVGFHLDLAAAICELIGVTCTVQAWPWEQVTDALADNQGDALIAGLAIDPANAERFDFSNIYMMLPGRFVTTQLNARLLDLEQLDGKIIAVRGGSTHETFLRRYMPNVIIRGLESEILALDAVRSGAVDAYFGDALRASFWLNENLDCCSFVGEPFFNSKLFGEGFAVATPAGKPGIRGAINYALSRLKQNGKLDELYLQWFPVSFY